MNNRISKMDRTAVRRPTELEQKYAFEKQFSENRALAEKAQSDSAEAVRIASEISETDKGLSLKVEALNNEINGEGGVKAQLDLKVETDADGNLKSKVHVQGNEFTVDTDNFQLDEEGNVAITGAFRTEVEGSSTDISGGKIHIVCQENEVDEDLVVTRVKHRILTFRGFDGSTYAVNACATRLNQTAELSYSGLEIEKV